MKRLSALLLLLCFAVIGKSQSICQPAAFPCAAGYGKMAGVCQPAKSIYIVNSLADPHNGNNPVLTPGTLRDAVSESNRYIIFKVSGEIHLNSTMNVSSSNIYWAGQTAFLGGGNGLTITKNPAANFNNALINIDGNHHVVRYLRFRRGPGTAPECCGDALGLYNNNNWIIDHCSFSWATDEILSGGNCESGTVQNSIISEGLDLSTHSYSSDPSHSSYQSGHSKGALIGWGGNPAEKITFYRNLFAHNMDRNPRLVSDGTVVDPTMATFEVINNVIYNCRYFNITFDNTNSNQPVRSNIIKNLVIQGSNTSTQRYMVDLGGGAAPSDYKMFIEGNKGIRRTSQSQDEWDDVAIFTTQCGSNCQNDYRVNTAFDSPLRPVFDSLPDAFASNELQSIVLADAGANLYRDMTDSRVINDVQNLTPTTQKAYANLPNYDANEYNGTSFYYGVVNDINIDLGGWETFQTYNVNYNDADADGIDDQWETANGYNPANAADALSIHPSGYPVIEYYFHKVTNQDCNNIIYCHDYNGGQNSGICSDPIVNLNPSIIAEFENHIYIEEANTGVILKSPNGTCFLVTIEDNGTMKTTLVTCP